MQANRPQERGYRRSPFSRGRQEARIESAGNLPEKDDVIPVPVIRYREKDDVIPVPRHQRN